jgi:hypothetical protein
MVSLAVAVAACATASCGDEATPVESARYGEGVVVSSTEPPVPVPTSATSVAQPPAAEFEPVAAARSPTSPANRVERVDRSGLRLVLVAGLNVTFDARDRVTFELQFENTTATTLTYDSNQEVRFRLLRRSSGDDVEVAWDNTACRASLRGLDDDKPVTGVLELAPGEAGNFIDDYPTKATSEQGFGPDPDSCRVPAGEYFLIGYVDWCPPESIRTSDYNGAPYCDRAKVVAVASAPLRLTFS